MKPLPIIITILILGGLVLFIFNAPSNSQVVDEELPTAPEREVPAPGHSDAGEMTVENEPGGEEGTPPRGNDSGMEFPIPDDPEDLVACTQEARMCPDGSYVGRTGPNCEFSACPTVTEEATPKTHVFDVSGQNFEFSVTEMRVKEGDTVTVNFESASGFHDWVVDEFNAATKQVPEGGKTSVTFVADKAGTYEYYCSVGQHRAQGMVGTLVVE